MFFMECQNSLQPYVYRFSIIAKIASNIFIIHDIELSNCRAAAVADRTKNF